MIIRMYSVDLADTAQLRQVLLHGQLSKAVMAPWLAFRKRDFGVERPAVAPGATVHEKPWPKKNIFAYLMKPGSLDTEFAVMSHQAEEVKPQAPVESEDLLTELGKFRVAYELYQSNKEARARPYGTRDRRYKSAALSLSTWTLIVAGIAEGPGHPKANADAHGVFVNCFEDMKRGQKLGQEIEGLGQRF